MPSFTRSFQYKVVCNCGESHQTVLFPCVSHWQTDLGTILQESKKKNTNPLAKIPTATVEYILRLPTGFWLMTNAIVFYAKAWEWNKDLLTIMEMQAAEL